MNGKGDSPRPMQISREEYGRRHDMAFGKKKRRKVYMCDGQGCKEVKEKENHGAR